MATPQELARSELQKRSTYVGQDMKPFESTVNPFNPNFRASVGSAIREFIDDFGFSGGYKQGLENLSDATEFSLDFIPGVGDAVGVGDLRQSISSGDRLGMGIDGAAVALGTIPIAGDLLAKGLKKGESALRNFASKDLFELNPEVTNADTFKSRNTLITLTPDEFLNLSPDLMQKPDPKRLGFIEDAIAKGKKLDAPFLYMTDKDGVAKVTGHEGRHRALALKKMGINEMPVILKSDRIRWGQQDSRFDKLNDKWPTTLEPQDPVFFGHTQTGKAIPFPVPFPVSDLKSVSSSLHGLDQSQAARMQRAQDLGFDTDNVFYHGAVTDIAEFDLNRGTPESHMGTAVYTTTGTSDASKNYASLEGPDLSNKITKRAEEIIDSGELSEQWADIYRKREVGTRKDVGKARNEASADLMNIAEGIAKEEFNDNLGVVYPLIGRSEKPFDISEGNDTFLSFEYPEFDPKDYLDEADGDMDIAADLARDDSYNFEPEGELTDFLYSIRRNLSDTEYSEVSNAIMESAYDGGISGKELEDIYRKAEIYSDDDLGRLNQMEIFRKGLEDAGFDSIIHDANRFNMDHVEGQKHQIFFKENQLRSPNAEFDPAKVDSSNLLSGIQPTRSALAGIA
jgi:hypothetical protein